MANKNSNFPAAQKPNITPEQMSDYITKLDGLRRLKSVNRKDPYALEERIDYFFKYCIENELKPSVELLSLALDISRVGLWMIEQEEGARGQIIRRAKMLLSALLEQMQLSGQVKETTAIWLQKQFYSMRDQIDITAESAQKPLNALPSSAEIIKRLPHITLGEDVDDSKLLEMLKEE